MKILSSHGIMRKIGQRKWNEDTLANGGRKVTWINITMSLFL